MIISMLIYNYMKNIQKVCEAVMGNEVIKATQFISPKLIVRAVRKRFRKRILKESNIEIHLTIGRPNYLEREFIKDCLKAKEPFPVKKVQLKLYDPKVNKLKGRKR